MILQLRIQRLTTRNSSDLGDHQISQSINQIVEVWGEVWINHCLQLVQRSMTGLSSYSIQRVDSLPHYITASKEKHLRDKVWTLKVGTLISSHTLLTQQLMNTERASRTLVIINSPGINDSDIQSLIVSVPLASTISFRSIIKWSLKAESVERCQQYYLLRFK